ncbi:PEPxxWA-CTERM sorting domain-containing protein [Sphingomonas rhizophila]|uniref:PEPxxWA-CTERM sorting domain-containing protein n=1 Tax=Sphingomonas rhizophila TaxID=2071607 RepID=A0A7G9S914_9SPHN|nr:PEPxxWA-CTERM sorting domain-containing protein [Sphingomonas rhizophila]QNN64339.1 PEPxxWA-CTERM sorting domain-containing protein [Sphingomonas rhizophila]
MLQKWKWSLKALLTALVLASASASEASDNLIANGGFETGDFTSWITAGDSAFTGVNGFATHSGDFAAYFSSNNPFTISQDFTTDIGRSYTFGFWAWSVQTSSSERLSFLINGDAIITLLPWPNRPFTYFEYTWTAISEVTQIGFTSSRGTYRLDDITVLAAPPLPAPEPGTWAMMLLGFGAIGAGLRRRRQLDPALSRARVLPR